MGSQGSLGLSEHRPWRWRTFPPSLSAEDLMMAHPRAISYSCALECLCLCQGGCCLPPAHILHGQCTRQPSPTALHHPWSERAHQLRVPDLDAQPPGPRAQLLKSYPPMGSSSSRALLARSHASAHRRTGEGGGAAWFPGSICSAPHAVDPVSDSHTAGGPAASKVGDPFLRVAFLFPEAEATTLFLT